jgi:hypothetical protein
MLRLELHGALIDQRSASPHFEAFVFAELHRMGEHLGMHIVGAVGGQGAGEQPVGIQVADFVARHGSSYE